MEGESEYSQLFRTCRSNWAQADPFLLQLFTSGFPKENKIHFNFAFSHNHSKVLLTKSIMKRDKTRLNSIVSQEQVDLFIPFNSPQHLWLKMTKDQIKVHYHHRSSVDLLLFELQPYFSFSSTRKFSNSSFKLGAIQQLNNGFVDLRYRFNAGEHRAQSFFYGKYQYKSERVRVGAIGTVLFKNRQINLQKNDVMAAFKIFDNNWVGLMLENQQFRKYRINYTRLGSYFDSLKAVYLFNHSNLHLGLLYQYSVEDSTTKKIQAAVSYKSEHHKAGFKLKLNTLWKMGVGVEAKLGRWKIEGGTTWFNIVSEGLAPSQYCIGLSYY